MSRALRAFMRNARWARIQMASSRSIVGSPARAGLAVTAGCFLIGAQVCSVAHASPGRQPSKDPFNPPPPPPPSFTQDLTLDELAKFDGSDPSKPILICLKGVIYDVSTAKHMYGAGGGYACFAGKDSSRAMALMSLDPKNATGDLSGLTAEDLKSLDSWEAFFIKKYAVVGKLISRKPSLFSRL
mmetsp:Transcript_18197/g.42798  ORF Transcript_18197/g.42798 Transcript_18197/m.42798 type:complete len:185 (-) Transcript_18197:56-610(-)|eukprot:CAMPEP_0114559634 /NCGR_PEP_ID=MMETSP0114-20121206/11025_1 /TAXON_ID=31324 /ORGANISM="Goniomonas sp, Strain m" /LENGTH=184 /DNA_ID=CAMNT_0001745115 /DNA_START=25 /DNA_END=579 /DNA_ORIENTATION=+